MLDVYWLEQTEADLPAENDWLSAGEALCLASMRFPKRRADWRLGRWTAKRILSAYLQLPSLPSFLSTIEIRPAPSGAPQVLVGGKPASITISLSHRAGTALCAVADGDVELGCDLELIEPRSQAFISDYFTAEERHALEGASEAERARLSTLIWSAKESALKALRAGLRLDTRSVTVKLAKRQSPPEDEHPREGSWRGLLVSSTDGQLFEGWWKQSGNLLRTVVGTPPPTYPRAFNCLSEYQVPGQLKTSH